LQANIAGTVETLAVVGGSTDDYGFRGNNILDIEVSVKFVHGNTATSGRKVFGLDRSTGQQISAPLTFEQWSVLGVPSPVLLGCGDYTYIYSFSATDVARTG